MHLWPHTTDMKFIVLSNLPPSPHGPNQIIPPVISLPHASRHFHSASRTSVGVHAHTVTHVVEDDHLNTGCRCRWMGSSGILTELPPTFFQVEADDGKSSLVHCSIHRSKLVTVNSLFSHMLRWVSAPLSTALPIFTVRETFEEFRKTSESFKLYEEKQTTLRTREASLSKLFVCYPSCSLDFGRQECEIE